MNLPPIPEDRVRCYPTREAWLAGRAAGEYPLGASEIAAVLGISPWSSPWDLWQRRRGAAKQADAPAMRRGRISERMVLSLYAQDTGLHACAPAAVWSPGRESICVVHGAEDWMRWSPDALVFDREWGGAEGKTAIRYEGWESGQIAAWTDGCEEMAPPYYAVQCYWALEVSGLPWIDLVALLPYYELVRVRIHRDAEIQEAITVQVRSWRERHLVHGEPPPVDGSSACTRYLAARHIPVGSREATPAESEMMRALANARLRAKAVDIEVGYLRNQLSAAAQGKTLTAGKIRFKPREIRAVEPETEETDGLDFSALV